MLQRQYEHLKGLRESEAARVERQVAEIQERNEAAYQAELERQRRLTESIQQSRKQQLQRKARDQQREREEEKIMITEWNKKNEEMAQAEVEEDALTRLKAIQLQSDLRSQIASKQDTVIRQVLAEREETRTMREARQREDQVFDEYTKTVIKNQEAAGLNTKPMKYVLHYEVARQMRPGNYEY